MNIKIFIAALVMTTNIAFSQDYMDDIALKSCECLSKIPDTLETETFNIKLGLCMIDAASPYKKQLKKDYKIDLNKIDKQAGKLGKVIGLRMASVCPDALMKMANRSENKKSDDSITENTIEGQITSIIDDKFVVFSIKNELGKISKYHWFTFIESNTDLSTDYKTLTDKFVQVTYRSQEFFDARIGEYRIFNVIQKIEIINE
jgi:hypothetical protein